MSLITTPTPFRSIVRVVQPPVEPVSLSEAKHHLGITPDVADDDEYILALISAARMLVEERLSMTLTATRWRAKLVGWSSCACRGVELPYPPVLVDDTEFPIEVKYEDQDGNKQTVDVAEISVDDEEIPGRLHVSHTVTGACCEPKVTVFWWAGVRTAAEVPRPARVAILRIVAGMYANRGESAEAIYHNDAGVASLLGACSWSGRS